MKKNNNTKKRYSRIVDVMSDLIEDIGDTEKELMRLRQSGLYYNIREDLSAFIKQNAAKQEDLKELLRNLIQAYDREMDRLSEAMKSIMLDTPEAKEFNKTRYSVAEAIFKGSICKMMEIIDEKKTFPLFS